ncbi:MAG: hypothetical protein L3J38_04865, partial [Thiomicrorhabdus sp.]|nr:hypothetical protein [Thiomicrorhabdus sp.]
MIPLHVKPRLPSADFNDSHQQIADHSNDGLIVLSSQLTPLLVNHTARQYLGEAELPNDIFKRLQVYTQKRKNILFDLKQWVQSNRFSPKKSAIQTELLWM